MATPESYHFPPQLYDLLVDTIPKLNKGKKGLITFFRGAGVSNELCADLVTRVDARDNTLGKYEIARILLTRINEAGDRYLAPRRELLKRVVEFESFTQCWPEDQYAAKGLVAEIRSVINAKDAFTRMDIERDIANEKHKQEYVKKVEEIKKREEVLEILKNEFYALFKIENASLRGKLLEDALNNIFKAHKILIKEAFIRTGDEGEGIIEQIDGVVEIDQQIFFVEMKWKKDSISNADMFQHLGRLHSRPRPNGIFISASGYSKSSIKAASEALIQNVLLVLTDFDELIKVIENRTDLSKYFRAKIMSACIDKNVYFKPLLDD